MYRYRCGNCWKEFDSDDSDVVKCPTCGRTYTLFKIGGFKQDHVVPVVVEMPVQTDAATPAAAPAPATEPPVVDTPIVPPATAEVDAVPKKQK
jgi:predicted  nucleic acid-binding Zn-ribbon protein